ncbi:MAG: copper chaperone [Lysobacter sp.]|nr:MAG: copper chaperone [Lysobacter sp.]
MRLLLACIILLAAGLASAASPLKVAVYRVDNFTCPACGLTVRKALDRVPGVVAKDIDAKAATVRVTFDPRKVSQATVASAITNAGFPAHLSDGR